MFFLFAFSLSAAAAPAVDVASVLGAYANGVHSSYSASVSSAKVLQQRIRDFVAAPTEARLTAAKEAWIEARKDYSPTEVYRFYEGPIDNADGPEGLINAWPLDEAYIDYVVGRPDSGIIQNVAAYPEITRELLASLNERDGEKNISTGYHAIEFLLWGQDFNPNGPGRRPLKDYVVGEGRNAERRAAYLLAAADLLVEHLKSLEAAWDPGAPSYGREFVKGGSESLRKLLLGAYRLAGEELSHERMFVAYDTQQQEDEHSCFSDTTHLDILYNFLGIKRVLESGPLALVRERSRAAAAALGSEIRRTETAVRAIPAPFDRAIYSPEGREKILAAVTALEDLAQAIQAAAGELGIRLE